ncbi:MAG: hypothetical protein AAFQ68_21045 [Bacteroidota bacterium]
MATTNASQRNRIIQKAKFPASKPITAYQFAKGRLQSFLVGGGWDFSYFDIPLEKLKYVIETDEQKRDDARRDLKCIEAFKVLMQSKKFSKYDIYDKKADIALRPIPEVLVNVHLDAALTETSDSGILNSGGIVLFTAATSESRKNIEVRRRQVTQLILWGLQSHGNIEPLPRLCMSLDVFGGEVIKAAAVSEQFRKYAVDACAEAALKWNSIEPPADYDGPDWT